MTAQSYILRTLDILAEKLQPAAMRKLDADAAAWTPKSFEELKPKYAALGCLEALFTLGDRPEARFPSHRAALRRFGHETTHA